MPRRSQRRAPQRSSRSSSAKSGGQNRLISWALNFVIAALAVVVVGFVYSSIHRIQMNEQAVDLSLEESIQKYEQNLAAELYEQKRFPDIWVEILNGNGVTGVAAQYTEFLRDKGFDVQRTDNADNFSYQNTVVIDRSDNREKAVAVASALQLDTSAVQRRIDPSLQLDVTVILGADYNQLPVYEKIASQTIP
ncbi:MAG TPA: LytR C-terminal domain-containing protein [bacterium]|nr:LytR C-terminal domain-containing protein [bacterium]